MSKHEDDPNWQIVWDRFRGVCVICDERAMDVHEIVPKSKCPTHWRDVDNRVTLCRKHHVEAHKNVVAIAPLLRERAIIVADRYS